jgi:hypothetical protein
MSASSLNHLISDLNSVAGTTPWPEHAERRGVLRIELPLPALVRGMDASGDRFELQTVLDTLSAFDLSLRLARPVLPGTRLFVVIRLSLAPAPAVPAARVALRGVVRCVAPQLDGRNHVGIVFQHHRFLYAVPS